LAASIVVAFGMGKGARGDLYTSAPTFPGSFTAFTSAGQFQVFDSFTVNQTGSFGSLQLGWQGFNIDLNNPQNNPIITNTNTFSVAIYNNAAGGLPNTNSPVMAPQVFTPSGSSPYNAFLTLQSPTNYFVNGSRYSVNIYNYSAVAQPSNPVNLVAGQTYWMTVFSSNPGTSTVWGWTSGSGPGVFNNSLQFNGSIYAPISNTHFAFSIAAGFGQTPAVPEPSTAVLSTAMVAAGLVTCAVRRRFP
jgi:hypothetical protein